MPEEKAYGCYQCGTKKSVRRVAVVIGDGDYHTELQDMEICAACASKTTVFSLVVRLDAIDEPDTIPDYPGDKK